MSNSNEFFSLFCIKIAAVNDRAFSFLQCQPRTLFTMVTSSQIILIHSHEFVGHSILECFGKGGFTWCDGLGMVRVDTQFLLL